MPLARPGTPSTRHAGAERSPASGPRRTRWACTPSVLDKLGQEIVSGTLPVDSVVRIDQLDERFGVSRSVVREAVRVLSSMGLVETRRRLGVRVLPRSQWNVFDPRVIRWRLDGPDREDQLVSLGELRRGFEPVAAELAADRATPDQCGAMAAAVMQMTVHAKSGRPGGLPRGRQGLPPHHARGLGQRDARRPVERGRRGALRAAPTTT